MKIIIIAEHGYEEALLGLGLSHGITSGMEFWDLWDSGELTPSPELIRMMAVARNLAGKGRGHDKFLESIQVWLDITAARYWWQEFDTYRVGTTKQSESTMHTITKREFTQNDFEYPLPEFFLEHLNALRRACIHADGEGRDALFLAIKAVLPEGFLQRRVVCTNYKVLQNMILQRRTHRLPEWKQFIEHIRVNARWPHLLPFARGTEVEAIVTDVVN